MRRIVRGIMRGNNEKNGGYCEVNEEKFKGKCEEGKVWGKCEGNVRKM